VRARARGRRGFSFERGAAERGPPPTGTAGDTRRAVQIFSRVEEKNPAQIK